MPHLLCILIKSWSKFDISKCKFIILLGKNMIKESFLFRFMNILWEFYTFNIICGWWVKKNLYHLQVQNIRKANHLYSNVWDGSLSVSLLSRNVLDRKPFTVYPSGSYSSIHLDFCHLAFHLFSLLSVFHHLAFLTISHLHRHSILFI